MTRMWWRCTSRSKSATTRLRASIVFASALWGCASGRDVEGTPVDPARAPIHAEYTDAGTVDAGDARGYERMLTRAHATFGLAESRGLDRERLDAVLDALADGFEGCAERAEREGWFARAGVRLVVAIDEHGVVRAVDPKLDDPERGGQLTLLCLVAPLRTYNFGDQRGTARRGFALEVLFGPPRDLSNLP